MTHGLCCASKRNAAGAPGPACAGKISFGEEVVSVPSVFDGQVELLFGVFASGRELEVRAQMPKSLRMLDSECPYVYCEGDVLRLPEAQRGIVRVLLSAQAGPSRSSMMRSSPSTGAACGAKGSISVSP